MLQSWLNQVCKIVPGVVAAIVVADPKEAEASTVVARWPAGSSIDESLLEVSSLASKREQALLVSGGASDGLLIGRTLNGAQNLPAGTTIALQVNVPQESQDTVLRLLDWSADWLRLLAQAEPGGELAASAVAMPAEEVCSWLQRAIAVSSRAELAHLMCLRLVELLNCRRVSIGLHDGSEIRLLATSASAEFDPQSELVCLLEAVMSDAADSGLPRQVCAADAVPRDAHFRFSAHSGGVPVYSIPLLAVAGDATADHAVEDHSATGNAAVDHISLGKAAAVASGAPAELAQPWAVVVCEGHLQQPFDAAYQQRAALWLSALVPLLRLQPRRQHSRWKHWRQQLDTYLGAPGSRNRRIAVGLCLLLVAGLLFGKATYRVNADAMLEGKIQRAVVAPFDSYISAAHARAGEQVEEGALLAELDHRQLQLELDKQLSQRDEYEKQYRQALAQLDRAQSRIVQAQIAQVDAEIELLQQQRARSQLRAPLAGIVIKGDLHHSLGAPVDKGQVLFELAPLREYRLSLQVGARDIAAVRVGQQGTLVLSALPQHKIPFVVQNIAAIIDGDSGETVYRTEAKLDFPVDSLRPGMQGVGKIKIGRRSIIWIALHDLLDWWRIRLWLWMP